MLGQRIRQYLVIERLGTGGMGRVYRAADESLGRDVALKILDTGTENSSARLRAEAGALARVNHPGIATVYELMEEDGRLVMAMELVRGQTIQQLLEQVGVFAPRQAAEFCMQTLAILQHAHAAGVVHRDLKPGNLMITEGGSIKIMDFGIARLDGSMALTSAGTMLGTPAYMAPEQVLGHPIDARADLYAMGVVFFRLITAALPFKGVTPFEMAQSQVNDEPARATDVCDGLPPWVDDIVARALAKKPDDRFQSADEFREALARAIAIDTPQPGVAAAMEITEALPRPALPTLPQKQPQPRAIWLTAAAALVLVTGLWMLIRANAAASNTAATQTLASVEPAPSPAPAQPDVLDAPVTTKVASTTSQPAATGPKPTPTPIPSTAATSPARPPASFTDVKFLAVNGARSAASDALVQFSDSEVSVQTPDGKTSTVALSYRDISKATYVQGRDPKWDPALSAPAEKIGTPGLGILSRTRHWLVLQGPHHYVILRLDGEDRLDVMKAFESRAGIVIDRPDARKPG